MKARLGLTALPFIAITWTAPVLAEPDHAAVNRVLADAVIMPAYEKYHQAMQALVPAIDALCDKPGDQTLAASQDAFEESVDAWQRLQPIAFGPIEDQAIAARIHFWPDKHGTAGKQLSKLLAKPDPAALENGVAGKSAALQSLAALERVLFDHADKITTADGTFACTLASAVATYQSDLAGDVLKAWQGDGGHYALFTNATDGNDAYYDPADAATDLFGALAATLDGIVANKLERPLGKSLEGAKPKRAEDWRSARSLANITANLETIEALYIEDGGLHVWLSVQGQDGLDQTLRNGLTQTLDTADAIDLPLFEAVGSETERQKVEQLLQGVISLRALFTGTLADAADLTIGFNKSDGD
ncbi:MAG: imelysin family protein [Geminicoccaceae bacterium]